jgi:anaerobic magnesium-protoporphyrin IX monomethyl ester cyclase
LKDCPGILIQSDNIVYDTGDRESIKNLNELSPPDFLDYTFEIYREPNRLPIMSSRSCPNKCIFCNERPYWREYRNRSAENVFEEIKIQLIRYPFINFIDFQDSLVNGKIRELEHLADLIIENGLKIQWAGQAIIRKEMTGELIQKIKQSGCVCLAYGLETPSEQLMLKIGKVMSRGADVDDIVKAHGNVGLGLVFNFMFGLPGETEEDAFEVLEFIRRNKNFISTVNPSPGFCLFLPGTQIFDNPQQYGIDISNGGMYWESIDRMNTYPVRLKRFEDFCRLAHELKISTVYPKTFFVDRNLTLGNYYFQIGDKKRAQLYYKAWVEEHPEDINIQNLLDRMQTEI